MEFGPPNLYLQKIKAWVQTQYFGLLGDKPSCLNFKIDFYNHDYYFFQVIAAPNRDRLCLAVARELEKGFGGWVPPFQILK